MKALARLRENDAKRIEASMTLRELREKHVRRLDNVTAIIETVTHQSPEVGSMIPIDHPLRKQKMLTFKQYVQAKGQLHDDYHIPLEQLNDRQLHEAMLIDERERRKTTTM